MDDTTLYFCDSNLPCLLSNLENDVVSTIMWFDANYMKSNKGKSHLLISGNTPELLLAKVEEKLFGKVPMKSYWV